MLWSAYRIYFLHDNFFPSLKKKKKIKPLSLGFIHHHKEWCTQIHWCIQIFTKGHSLENILLNNAYNVSNTTLLLWDFNVSSEEASLCGPSGVGDETKQMMKVWRNQVKMPSNSQIFWNVKCSFLHQTYLHPAWSHVSSDSYWYSLLLLME